MPTSIQERYFAESACFGCGPANPQGLRLHSTAAPDGDGVVATWQPQLRYAAAPGVLNGGIVGTLLDCHAAAALYHLLRERGDDSMWATAEFTVALRRPTSHAAPLELFARVVELDESDARIEARLESEGKLRATCTAHFRRFELPSG